MLFWNGKREKRRRGEKESCESFMSILGRRGRRAGLIYP
jgi:hypothetical protein